MADLRFRTQVSDAKVMSLQSLELFLLESKDVLSFGLNEVHLKTMQSPDQLFVKVLYQKGSKLFFM